MPSRNRNMPVAMSRAKRAEEVSTAFRADYRAYQYRFVEFYIEHVVDVGRAFKGDLQSVLVLAVLGQVWLKAVRAAEAEGQDPDAIPQDRLSITSSRISDVTDIPRQTVRRKLKELERRGWLLRNDDGAYRLASSGGRSTARRDLSDVDGRALERIAKLFVELEGLVEAQADRASRAGQTEQSGNVLKSSGSGVP
ncbi:hypothetical protein [Rhodovulum strictum]|uniref:HTH iclR-type domain-containing protein n=1 Tax=Rhodovulum strictum TaxID=58314 RepID=A0A844BCB0_9RHOB|nr:hypothetical protein [Rhodovulum strictum]MRH22094.1 hypothetical protein [Rhodovulum strictum]